LKSEIELENYLKLIWKNPENIFNFQDFLLYLYWTFKQLYYEWFARKI
jgi:hypothetical protein